MKRTLTIASAVIIFGLVAVNMTSLGNVTLSTITLKSHAPNQKDKQLSYEISKRHCVSLPDYDWKESKNPLSIEEAIKIAWRTVESKQDYYFGRATLSFVNPDRKMIWFYTVEFDPATSGFSKSVIVLLDGSVVEPKITEVEETPTSGDTQRR